ncbi:MAG TPA: hypothetical protein VFG77_01615 [Nitrososphaeraceae archaeon]|nr:hypothetical protein [Nitrososphaeraceae archaeon]
MKPSFRLRISNASKLGFSAGFLFLSVCLSLAISPYSLQKPAMAQDQSPGPNATPLREEIATEIKDELTQSPRYSPNSVSQTLNYSHFVPLSPISNSPGNQVKLLLNYNVTESSLIDNPINAILEVYAANQSLIRTSSLPHPLNVTGPEGTIQLATTLNDNSLKNITAVALLTDDEKAIPISNVLEARLNLGEMSR